MNTFIKISFFLVILLLLFVGLNIGIGSVPIDWTQAFESGTSDEVIFRYRSVKVATAILVGISLPISGMLLQEYFKNVLAGPSIMGVSSSAGLGIALFIFLGLPVYSVLDEWTQYWGMTLAGMLGSFACLLLLLSIARYLRDKSNFIILGFLISALAGAIISILEIYSGNDSLKQFILWSLGSFSGLSSVQLILFFIMVIVGMVFSWLAIRQLQGNILGEMYAQSVGVNLNKMKYFVLLASSILTGVCTTMVGPIAFVGIIVPFFSRMWISEAYLMWQAAINILLGCTMMLGILFISEQLLLPINILTSFLGIPMIAYIVLKSSKNL